MRPAATAAASAYSYPLLLKQLWHATLTCSPTQEIVYRGTQRYTYRDLHGRIQRLAGGLTTLGVRPGDTVAVMDWDSHRYLETYFAVPMLGAVLQTVNIRLSVEQILYTLNHAGAKVLLVHADFVPMLRAMRNRLSSVTAIVAISEDGDVTAFDSDYAAEYEQLLAGAAADFEFPEFPEDTRATTFYTTGTTGLPKGVYFSHRQLVLHTLGVGMALASNGAHQSFTRNDVYMPITPMFHVHAWGMPYVATLLGVKQVYPGRYVAGQLLDLIRDEQVTFSHCVPTVLRMVLDEPKARQTDLTRWKVVIGGAALTPALAQAAVDQGIDVFTGYGMSETCPILTLSQLSPGERTARRAEQIDARCRTGRPVPLVDMRLVDPQMRDVAHDARAVGEVVVRAPWVTQGYLGDAEASEQLWHGGYLHTQDVGSMDASGCLRITDRVKDVIKSGGEWVSSLQLESCISTHAAVGEVAVIGVEDDKWGERPLALVVLRPQASTSEQEIIQHVAALVTAGVIRSYAVPRQVLFVREIDKTGVGKIDKKLLRQKYAAAARLSA